MARLPFSGRLLGGLLLIGGGMAIVAFGWPLPQTFRMLRFSAPWADVLFRYWTWLGTGWVFLPVMGWVLWKRQRHWRWVLVSMVSFGVVNFLFKRVLFSEMLRPAAYAAEWGMTIHSPVRLHHYHAMPSGHTGTAFVAATIVALLVRRPWVRWLAWGLALGVGYSRVYLGQHFPRDVVVGMALGIVIPLICYRWLAPDR